MTKKQKNIIVRIIFSALGVAILLGCIIWAGLYFPNYISIPLYAIVPILCCFFAFSIIKNKESLFKICVIALYTSIIILIATALFMRSGLWNDLINVSDAKELSDILQQKYGNMVGVAIIIIEFLQVTFIPIPSSIVTGAAYYICGQNPWLATLYSCIGLWIGSLLAFFLGRTFGIRLVKWVAGEKMILKYNNFVRGKDKVLLIYMFILPVFPDDVLCMFAGLTTMTYPGFIIVQLISRPLNVGATIAILHFSTSLTQIIPLTTAWGIICWIIIVTAFIALFILTWKKGEEIEKIMYKCITKVTGRTILTDINQLYHIKPQPTLENPIETPSEERKAFLQTLSADKLQEMLDDDSCSENKTVFLTQSNCNINYCDCNIFAHISQYKQETSISEMYNTFNYSKHVASLVSERTIRAFDRISELYNSFINGIEFLADDGTLKTNMEGEACIKYNELWQLLKNTFYLPHYFNTDDIDKSCPESIVVGMNHLYYIGFKKREKNSCSVSDLRVLIAKLFGFENTEEFLFTLKSLNRLIFTDIMDTPLSNRLQLDGAIRTSDNSFIFPYAVLNKDKEYVLTFVFMDAKGNISVWLQDVNNAKELLCKKAEDEEKGSLQLLGRCVLFELPSKKLLAEKEYIKQIVAEKEKTIIAKADEIVKQKFNRMSF